MCRAVAGIALCLLLSACAATKPFSSETVARKIVSVEQWGGTRSDVAKFKPHVITHITLHHGGVAFLRDQDPHKTVRNLQNWSRNTRMWSDIPYHYLIDLDGVVYEGRDITIPGDSNTNYDPTGHALIVVLGNFEEVEPNPAQLGAVVDMMAMIASKYRVSAQKISGHRNYTLQTVCPGKNMATYLENGYFQREVAKLTGLQ